MFYLNIEDLKEWIRIEYPDDSDYFALGAAERMVLDEKKYLLDELLDFIEENKEIM